MRVIRLVLAVSLALAMFGATVGAQDQKIQHTGKVYRIGHLGHSLEPGLIAVFREALRELGHVEGGNIFAEYRYAEGTVEPLPRLAAELVRAKVDVIVANGTPATRAAQQATSTIPVVMVGVGVDPVQAGLVRSLAHPGGNVTGVVALGMELSGKRLDLLREAFPIPSLWTCSRVLRQGQE